MVIGPFINSVAIITGGVLGTILKDKLPERLRLAMPMTFGIASLGMGLMLVVKGAHMPVMVLALVLGSLLGELCYLEKGISLACGQLRRLFDRQAPDGQGTGKKKEMSPQFVELFVAIVVLFCASGTGIFGAMHEGMGGDASVLIAKSFLDVFTAAIFATTLGISVAFIAVPQLTIQLALAFAAQQILPHTTSAMLADFTAVGGLIMLATGFRICAMKNFPVANMLPSLVLVMPISLLWSRFF
jgi:uncharacterized membrane protein YqgA involved in biofilm formation